MMQNISLLSAQDASVNITSIPLKLGDLQVYSIQADFSTGTLAGTLTLEASNNDSDYVGIASEVIAAGASHIFNVVNAAYLFVRLTWTQTAGTGNLTATALVKETPVKGA